MNKIPFHIISGFLGSGKTTFLKRILEKYSGEKRIGVIQNEYAPANIDGEELKKTGDGFHILEINNGSVFCVCLLGSFTRSLEKFITEVNPEIIVMEASGLSDTTSVSEVLSAGSLGEKIYLASNWCVVDSRNFERTGLMKQRVTHQIRMADYIILNKTDLSENNLEKISGEIQNTNPFAEIQKSKYCRINFELGGLPVDKFYLDKVTPLDRPDIKSMVIKSTRKINLKSFQLFMEEWARKAIRIKGFVNLDSGETIAVQSTFNNYSYSKVETTLHPTEIIAITTKFNLHEWNKSFKELSLR